MNENHKMLSAIPANCKAALLGAAAAGLAAHLFNFTNVLKNYDNIVLSGYGAGIYSGRWFLNLLGDWTADVWGVYNVPFFNGIISLILLAAAAAVIVSMFSVTDSKLAALWGGMFVVFPAVTSMMFFLFTSVFYSLAVLMTVIAAWAADRWRFGFLLSAVLAGSAIGIYQAYFPMMAGLLLTMLILDCLDTERQWSSIIRRAIRFLLSLILSLAFYFVMLQYMLDHVYHTQLGGYQGIDQTGHIDLSQLGAMLKRTYGEFLRLPIRDYYGISDSTVVRFGLIVLLIISLIAALSMIMKGKIYKNVPKTAFLILFAALYPAAVHSVVLMCYNSHIYTIMVYAEVVIYLMPIVLLQRLGSRRSVDGSGSEKVLPIWLRRALLLTGCLVMTNYIWQANGNYTAMYYSNEQTYEYFNALVTRVRSTPGYNNSLKWVFIGDTINDELYHNRWADTMFDFGGSTKDFDGQDLINAYSRKGFISQILGIQIPEASAEKTQKLSQKAKIKKMPCYPADGSICVYKEKYVIIKLENVEAEEYAEKTD